jgi:hypothetical protein
LKQPLSWGNRVWLAQIRAEGGQHLVVDGVMTDHHHRSPAVAAGDVGQARYRPVPHRGLRLDAGRIIDRAPPGGHRFLVRAGPRSVVTVDQALIGGYRQPGLVGDGLRRLDRPPQRAGDHQGGAPRAQRRPEPPGLLTPVLIQRWVGQAAQGAGLVEWRLPVPGQVDDSAVRGI